MQIVYNYIPENLDLNQLSKNLPVNSNLNTCKLGYFVSLIIEKSCSLKGIKVNGYDYVPLSSKILRERHYNYKEVLQFLNRQGVISISSSYASGKYCRGYKLVDKYVGHVSAVPITDQRFKHNVVKKYKSNSTKDYSLTPVKYLDKWLDSSELDFDMDKAKQILSNLQEIAETSGKMLSNHQIQVYSLGIAKCSVKDKSRGKDKTSGRYHSYITNLKSDFRNCFTYNGRKLFQLDLVNAQPYFMQALLNEDFWNKGIHQIAFQDTELEPIRYKMLQKSAQTLVNTDSQDFLRKVNSGRFYEGFISLVKQQSNRTLNRNDAKLAMFQVLFSANSWRGERPTNPKYDATLKECFAKAYPSIYSVVEDIKEGRKNRLAVLLQRIESHLLIDTCCKRITLEKPKCPIVTIHDSISTTEGYVEYVSKVIKDECQKFIGVAPVIKTSVWE